MRIGESPLLTAEQRESVLRLLVRGASPAGACQELEIPLGAFLKAQGEDAEFQAQLHGVNVVLSQNVAAALYRAAMEGNVTAQTFWLKCCPPPGWIVEITAEGPQTFDEVLDNLTPHELAQLACAMEVDLPAEIEAGLDPPGGGDVAGGLPGDVPPA